MRIFHNLFIAVIPLHNFPVWSFPHRVPVVACRRVESGKISLLLNRCCHGCHSGNAEMSLKTGQVRELLTVEDLLIEVHNNSVFTLQYIAFQRVL